MANTKLCIMKRFKLLILALPFLSLSACDNNGDEPEEPKNTRPRTLEEYNLTTDGLKDYFTADDFFDIGVAIEPASVDNQVEANLMKRHFSSITAENAMKWSSLQPTEGTFRFTNADKIVNFASNNGMKMRGHTLVWHSQCPDWVFQDNGAVASKELVLERMRTHITEVMTRYKGKVDTWDVVNEAIDDGSNTYRSSKWYGICGEDFIFEAFRTARQVDPDAKLFYNDYSATNPTKREKIYTLLSRLKAEGLVDGMGLQGHWNIDAPASETIIEAFNRYASLGIKLHITELDVSVYPSNSDPQTDYNTQVELRLKTSYARFFNLFRLHKDKITNVTFWGLADQHSWLNGWPVAGRNNYPLLFDRQYNPKAAYFSVINF
jgi:endo-1,4-beta-xylanase